MAIDKVMWKALQTFSSPSVDITKRYNLIRHFDAIKAKKIIIPPNCSYKDEIITSNKNEIPVRIFSSDVNKPKGLMLFIHGGGWVTGTVQSYTGVCFDMLCELNCTVVSIDYRRAPEFHFPCALEDCYDVAYALFASKYIPEFNAENITVIGDSAGGNLAAALSLLARDRGAFAVKRQILLYPSLSNDHTPNSPFDSIRENGTNYLLTSEMVEGYMKLYQSSDEDKINPYLAPLLCEDLTNQPDTLIITAEFCPLRDEGEEYGTRLKADGGIVKTYRMPNALHGFFSFPRRFSQVKKAYSLIANFLEGDSYV